MVWGNEVVGWTWSAVGRLARGARALANATPRAKGDSAPVAPAADHDSGAIAQSSRASACRAEGCGCKSHWPRFTTCMRVHHGGMEAPRTVLLSFESRSLQRTQSTALFSVSRCLCGEFRQPGSRRTDRTLSASPGATTGCVSRLVMSATKLRGYTDQRACPSPGVMV